MISTILIPCHARFTIVAILLWCLLFTLFACSNSPQPGRITNQDLDLIEKSVLPGDIILRKGHGLVSNFIALNYGGKHTMSHCGIVTKTEGKLFVIHCISGQIARHDGVIKEPLKEFVSLNSTTRLKLFSISNQTIEGQQKLTASAEQYASLNIPFDHNFDLSDTNSMFCIELITCCMQKAYKNRLESTDLKNKHFIGLELFDDTSLFVEKIIREK